MLPEYERMLETIYRAVLRPGDIAIDIGAHVGRHTLPMAQATGPKGKVIAFEPLPSAYSELTNLVRSSRSSSGMAQVITHNLALGVEEGESQFIFVPDFPEYSGFKKRTYHDDSLRIETIKVQVRQLDSFEADFGTARFIKIDAEGGELAILRGAAKVLANCSPIVSFEMGDDSLVNYSYSAADYFDFFADLGYSIFSIFGIPLLRDEFILAAEQQYFWDYIAIPGRGSWQFGHEHIRVLINQLGGGDSRPAESFMEALRARTPRRVITLLRRFSEFYGR
jgi:FkbM family methyltransferase